MLKPNEIRYSIIVFYFQPPSGGCVLKLERDENVADGAPPAAFGRLCVETRMKLLLPSARHQPPSGGCVLKPMAAPR